MRTEEVFNEGPTTSQHVESTSDRHFNATTFKLKRTRSMGLFDSSFLVQKPQTDKTKRFVTSQTIDKLNLPQDSGVSFGKEDESIPSFYTSVITPSNRRKAKEVAATASASDAGEALSSAIGSQGVCLIPKHQLKKQQHYTQHQLDSKLLSSTASSPSSASPHNDIINQLHDDMDVKDAKNVPREHVDYLTHKWDEDEISKSWKYVVLRRTAVADAARLENASWRTWAQTRNNLKTIPASDLDWEERDNDVTWLYGPVLRPQSTSSYLYDSPSAPLMQHSDSSSIEKLHLNNTDQLSSSSASSNEKSNHDIFYNNDNKNNNNNHNDDNNNEINANNDNTNPEYNSLLNTNNSHDQVSNDDSLKLHVDDIPTHLKSILKKKSNVERVISDASYSRLQNLLETRENKLKSMSPILEPSTTSDIELNEPNLKSSSRKTFTDPLLIKSSLKNSQLHIKQNQNNDLLSHRENKRIHFNPRVTQCIAIEYPDDYYNDEYKNSSDEEDLTPVSSFLKSNYTEDSDFNINNKNTNVIFIDNDNDEEMNDESNANLNDDDDDDDDGIIIINNKSPLPNISHKPHLENKNSKCNHADVTTISPLPATTLNMGPDEVSEEKEQTTLSHNIKTNKGLNHYDYNSVYTGNSDLFKVKDVEMVDIPANIELDNIDSMDVDSLPIEATTYEHLEDQPMSDISDSYNSYQSMSEDDSAIDSEANNDDMLTFGSDLKRTLSLGGTTFGSRSNSTQSLSQIKTGLSGLDLKGSGILKSTGLGSKPQLSELMNSSQKLYQPQPIPPMFQKSNSNFGKGGNTFLLNDSSSGSESDTESESESESGGFRGGFDLQNAANSCVKGSTLSAVNKQFLGGATSGHDLSRMNANQSKMKKGFLLNSDEFSDDSEEDELSFGARNRKI